MLYERFYLTSAARNRITMHVNNVDRTRAYELVDMILAAGSRTAERTLSPGSRDRRVPTS